METTIDEVADNIFRFSTFPDGAPLPFNQFIVRGERSLLFHTGMRALFPLVSDAVAKVVPLDQLEWITFGHVEADECGAMNQFLAIAPNAKVAHGALGCMVQVNDLADRAPHPLEDGEVIDLGNGKRVRNIETPHLPHGWDAHVMFEESTRTLLSGDLFTQFGPSAVTTTDSIVETALQGEDFGGPTALTATTGSRIRGLAELEPTALALMHGPTFLGDASKQLIGLGDGYDRMFDDTSAARV
jgi:flavorubredoxin